mgnify:CR=1 FL=1
MPKNSEIINELDSQLLKDIRKLASCNLAPNEIALKLGINKAGFMRIWRDEDSEIRQYYEAGLVDIAVKKRKALNKQIKKGNVTAMQIHDKMSEEAEFEAAKKEIFGLE